MSAPSLSRQSRLEKPVLSEVSPCRTTATVRPPGSRMAASIGFARYSRRRMGWTALDMAEARR